MSDRIKALIVDDERLVRAGISRMIEQCAPDIELCGEANDGEEAMAIIRQKHPRLVFTDIVMPRMDGIELLKNVMTFDPGIVTVVLSSYQDFDYVKKAFLFGASNYILKYDIAPESFASVMEEVRKCVYGAATGTKTQIGVDARECFYSERKLDEGETMAGIYLLDEADGIVDAQRLVKRLDPILDDISYYGEPPAAFFMGRAADVDRLLIKLESEAARHCWRLNTGIARADGTDTAAVLKGKTDCALDRRFFDASVSNAEYCKEWEKSTLQILEAQTTLVNSIMGKNTQNPEKALETLKSMLERLHGFKAVQIKLFFVSAAELINLKCAETLRDRRVSFESIQQKMLSARSLGELCISMRGLIEASLDVPLEAHGLREASEPVRAAAIYVNRNFADCDLTINKLSQYIKYSASYISRQFKAECGINLIDYIAEVRIQHAKKLLASGETKVFRVAEQVGFANYNYFSKVFKKMTGSTPSEYMFALKERK